ncbi:hypothetical protein RchiOBHm_Chr2g0139891 [Rosa chinensis]|uniref:Uncharacterized protein n=1 Tax=Rosa chinensis TaxID=74649 RepID=A0A2P6RX70_ROSCH|nr:hypothetical protein RchiOBHm_Chr2g0139891 [Rosa chinensis]
METGCRFPPEAGNRLQTSPSHIFILRPPILTKFLPLASYGSCAPVCGGLARRRGL